MTAVDDGIDDLEKLAAEVNGGDCEARVVTPRGRRSFVHVRNRRAGALTENIYAGDGWYWWGWCERIGPVTDPPAAARAVARVVGTLSGSNDQIAR